MIGDLVYVKSDQFLIDISNGLTPDSLSLAGDSSFNGEKPKLVEISSDPYISKGSGYLWKKEEYGIYYEFINVDYLGSTYRVLNSYISSIPYVIGKFDIDNDGIFTPIEGLTFDIDVADVDSSFVKKITQYVQDAIKDTAYELIEHTDTYLVFKNQKQEELIIQRQS